MKKTERWGRGGITDRQKNWASWKGPQGIVGNLEGGDDVDQWGVVVCDTDRGPNKSRGSPNRAKSATSENSKNLVIYVCNKKRMIQTLIFDTVAGLDGLDRKQIFKVDSCTYYFISLTFTFYFSIANVNVWRGSLCFCLFLWSESLKVSLHIAASAGAGACLPGFSHWEGIALRGRFWLGGSLWLRYDLRALWFHFRGNNFRLLGTERGLGKRKAGGVWDGRLYLRLRFWFLYLLYRHRFWLRYVDRLW